MSKERFAVIFGLDKDNKNEYIFETTALVNYDNKTNQFSIKTGNYIGNNEKAFSLIKGDSNFIYGNNNDLEIDGDNFVAIYIFDNQFITRICRQRKISDFDAYVYIADKISSIKIVSNGENNYLAKKIPTKQAVAYLATPNAVEKQISVEVQSEPKKSNETEQEKELLFDENIDLKSICKSISDRIVGQEEAIDTLVYNIYYNQKLINNLVDENGGYDPSELDSRKVSILLDGSTGTGKTAIAKLIAEYFDLPIVIVNANKYSETGYVGPSITETIDKLIDKADGNLDLAERGIIFFDEIDKIASDNEYSGKDMHKGVQEELLGFISGGKYDITGDPFNDDFDDCEFDTSKITFILSGAFTDLKDKKEKELLNKSIGFNNGEAKKDSYTITSQDYINYGLLREFFGRIKVLAFTKDYSKADLKNILLNSTISPLKNLEKTVMEYGYEGIIYDDNFIDKVVDEAFKMKTGARSLDTVISGIRNLILKDLVNHDFDDKEKINIKTEYVDTYTKKLTRKLIKE